MEAISAKMIIAAQNTIPGSSSRRQQLPLSAETEQVLKNGQKAIDDGNLTQCQKSLNN